MTTISFPPIEFLVSVAQLKQLPPDQGYEMAFAGRSNAGKSSALNAITGNKKLAKISKTPGRTQLINFFSIDAQHHLVDLPGYGYAQVSQIIKERWQKTLIQYLTTRKSLCGLILIMDIRHPLKETDLQMLEWAQNRLPIHILLTKADKLSRGAAQQTLQQVQKSLQPYSDITIQLFSAKQPLGIDLARKHILAKLHLT